MSWKTPKIARPLLRDFRVETVDGSQNGWLSAITITTTWGFRDRRQLDQIQNGWLSAIICLISGKPCRIARPFKTINQNVWFEGEIFPEKFQLEQIFKNPNQISLFRNILMCLLSVYDLWLTFRPKSLTYIAQPKWLENLLSYISDPNSF